MFMRELVAAGLAAALAVPAAAQDGESDRRAADLPVRLPETGERSPAAVPRSSAGRGAQVAPQAGRYGLGRPAEPAEIAALDIDVMPDGAGAPEGRGSYDEGQAVYAARCATCHGADLQGGANFGAPRLIGGRGTLDGETPVRTVESYWPHASTLFDYIHRAMPFSAPGSLTDDEVYAVTAYILGRAGIVAEGATLSADRFEAIEMPNEDGFTGDPRPDAE